MDEENCNNLIRSDNFHPSSRDLDIDIHGAVNLDTQKFLDDYWTMGLSKQFNCKEGRKDGSGLNMFIGFKVQKRE